MLMIHNEMISQSYCIHLILHMCSTVLLTLPVKQAEGCPAVIRVAPAVCCLSHPSVLVARLRPLLEEARDLASAMAEAGTVSHMGAGGD